MDVSETKAVTLKLPTFWSGKPKLWFCSVEAQFAIRNITVDETKYYYVVSALSDEMASAVSHILMSPPATNKYDALKKALLKFYTIPPVKNVLDFINLGTVADRRPREVAKEIGALDANKDVFRMALFVNAMPSGIRTHLLAREFSNVNDMADTAEALASQGITASATISEAQRKVSKELCFFHRKFGKKARRCRPPCSMSHTVNAAMHDTDPGNEDSVH